MSILGFIMAVLVALVTLVTIIAIDAAVDRKIDKRWESLKGTMFSRTYWHDIKEEQ